MKKLFTRFSLLIFLVNSNLLVIAQSNLTVTTSFLTPHLRTFDSQGTYWQTLVTFDRSGPRAGLHAALDFGSETERYNNSFRIYELNFHLQAGLNTLAIGRLIHWSTLTPARIDGMEAVLKTSRFGVLKILGGFKAVDDFSDTSFVQPEFFEDKKFLDKTFFLTSWSKGGLGRNLNISFWGDGDNGTMIPFAGIASSFSLIGVHINETLVMDLDQNRIHYSRVRFHKSLGNHRLGMAYRQGRYGGLAPWPWMKDLKISPTYVLDWTWKIPGRFQWVNRLNIRPGGTATVYLNSGIRYRRINISVLGGSKGDAWIAGGSVGFVQRSGGPLSYGGDLSVNLLDYEGLVELQNTSSIYGWIDWGIIEKLKLRLFIRYQTNPYYKKDGRMGMVVYVKV